MNTRFKIVCVLFGIIYFYFIGMSIIQGIPGFKAGFKDGRNAADRDHHRGAYSEGNESRFLETIEFHINPVSGEYSFPNSVLNLKTGTTIFAEFPLVKAKVDKSPLPKWISTLSTVFALIIAFPLLFAIVFIPVQIFRVIRSIVKNEIFDARNVNRIRWIGYSLLLIFVTELFTNIVYTIEAHALVSMENYRIVFRMDDELNTLLFALVTFMFAEILKISHTMKEEQDLTI